MNLARLLATAACAWVLNLVGCGGDNDSAPAPSQEVLTVGALLSLTGSWSSLGLTSQAALQLGVDDVNAHLASIGAPRRVRLLVEDTQLDPTLALDKLKKLAARGAHLIVGPQSSAETRAVKAYADHADVLVVSQGSTAHSLAIAGDNIFRLCPDDVQEAAAIAALMWRDGTRLIVPATRQDAGNEGLQTSTKDAFEALGGTVADGVTYATDVQDFSSTLGSLEPLVAQAIAQVGAHAVAVYLTAFDEVATLFGGAGQHSSLAAVRWYGSDGVASSPAVLAPNTASFAVQTGYPCPIFGLDPSAAPAWQPLRARITASSGITPDAFALSTYDAVWIAALAAQEADGDTDFVRFKNAFAEVADHYTGVTGSTRLNDAGDRASGTFDFMAVCSAGSRYLWQTAGTFQPELTGTDQITYAGCR